MSTMLSHITIELLGKLGKGFKRPAPGLQFSNPLQSFCSVSNPSSPKAQDCRKKKMYISRTSFMFNIIADCSSERVPTMTLYMSVQS
jgi:hypothetical protein